MIANTATVTWEGGSASSNTAEFTVPQVAGVELAPATATVTSIPGGTVYFSVTAANTGNGDDVLQLSVASSAGWPIAIYQDDSGAGLLEAAGTTLVTQTEALLPGDLITCIVAVTVPTTAAGTSEVIVTATSTFDPTCAAAGTYTVTAAPVAPPPSAEFSASPTYGNAPLTVSFTDMSGGSPTSWAWDFGDGTTSADQNPTHAYADPGAYTVALTIANGLGQDTELKSRYIIVSATDIAADFTASPTRGPAPLVVSFKDLSTGYPTAWEWSFGDGQTSIDQDPTHVYATPGTYTVRLMVSGGSSSSAMGRYAYIVVGFSDVPSDSWAYQETLACIHSDILNGYPDGTFRPSVETTRDQMAVYIARAVSGGDDAVPEPPAQASFADVPASHWAARYVEYAKQANIILGYPDGLFHPAEKVNRGQMAVFIARSLVDPTGEEALRYYSSSGSPTFPDVTASNEWSWCHKHVEYIASEGVAMGYPDGLYHPEIVCTRDQLAVYLARAFGLVSRSTS